MIITKRDKAILRFIEEYKSITITQCSKIFFKDNKCAYYQSRRRLSLLYNEGHLKRYRKNNSSESVYFQDKKLSVHDLKVLDIYAELYNLGAKITYLKQEYDIPTKDSVRRADGLLEVEYKGCFYPIIIECDFTHFSSKEKLDSIYHSNHFQEKYKDMDNDIFPLIIIVRVSMPVNIIDTQSLYNIHYTEFDLKDLIKVFDY